MYNNQKILALILARGGSKGLPRKNVKILNGKPLIAWSIEQGKQSKYIDKVVVSTEDKEIADVSKKYGADVPFYRPKELASDTASSMDAVFHAINWLENAGEKFDILVLLEPTSPLRESSDLDTAIETLLANKTAQSIVGISKVESVHPIFLSKIKNNLLKPYVGKKFNTKRRQDIDDLYFFEGSLYISYIEALKEKKGFYHDKTMGYIVPKWKSFEIDDMTDFIIIETLLKAKEKNLLK